MLRKILILFISFTVAKSTSDTVIGKAMDARTPIIYTSDPSSEVDAAGIPINDTDALRKVDAAGVPINETDLVRKLDTDGVIINDMNFQMMPEEAIEFRNGNSLEERRGCFPTLSCTRAGGYCIRPKSDCNGTVDTQGCRRGRRCKCCIPDQSTSTPLTCPTTQPIYTCPAVTPCSTSAIPTTTDIPTIHVPTAEGSTVDPNLSWLSVGADRFVRFPQKINWFDARRLCEANGLDLYEPKDIKAVAIYLENNFSEKWYWIGARSNGTHHVWLSGGVLSSSDPWYGSKYNDVNNGRCLEIITHSGYPSRNETLYPLPASLCSRAGYQDVLCG